MRKLVDEADRKQQTWISLSIWISKEFLMILFQEDDFRIWSSKTPSQLEPVILQISETKITEKIIWWCGSKATNVNFIININLKRILNDLITRRWFSHLKPKNSVTARAGDFANLRNKNNSENYLMMRIESYKHKCYHQYQSENNSQSFNSRKTISKGGIRKSKFGKMKKWNLEIKT